MGSRLRWRTNGCDRAISNRSTPYTVTLAEFSYVHWHASAHFEGCRYEEAVHWYRRALSEQPKAIWINRFLTASFALAGRKQEAKQSFTSLSKAFPVLTIAQVRSGLPHSISLLDRLSDGLESAGMRLC